MQAIVWILRGCPAGWLGAYGNEWVGTPNLDRIAAEGVVFDRHISNDPSPAGACAAWLGGPTASGPRLLATLQAAGIRTVLVRANQPPTDAPEWFYAGWDEVFDARPLPTDRSPLASLLRRLPHLLDRLADSPYLLWIEIDRLLPPWTVDQEVFEAYVVDEPNADEAAADEPQDEAEDSESSDEADGAAADDEHAEESDPAADPADTEPVLPWTDPPTGWFDTNDLDSYDWLHSSFAAVVTTLDAELGRMFQHLRDRGLDRTATWIITSDLGYPLGEHGQVGLHRPWLHEELVHLPLLLRWPGGVEAGRRIPAFTQPPDLAPTLLAVFGLTPEAGCNLLPLAQGQQDSPRRFAITRLELGEAAEAALRTADWAYLLPLRVPDGETRTPQLYEKPDDRWEVNDLRLRNIERADELDALLRTALATPP
jgi:arylsulfatase A-like enzyme